MIFIYTLSDPRSLNIRYIGKTNNIKTRINQHVSRSVKKKTHLDCWVNNLKENRLRPIIEVVGICDELEWEFWEKYWISQFITWGFNLVNTSDGGLNSYSNYKKVLAPKKRHDSRKILKYSIDGCFIGEYDSIADASNHVLKARTGVYNTCVGKQNTYDGFRYVFYTEGYPLVIDKYVRPLNSGVFKLGHKLNAGMKIPDESKRKMSLAHGVSVVGVKDGVVFRTIRDAALYYNISFKTLSSQLFNNSKSAIIRYVDESRYNKHKTISDTI